MITIEEALRFVDRIIKPERLNSIQELILIQCWSGKTYQEIANDSGYDPDYVRVVGSRLWQLLSESLGEKITKNNFRSMLRQQTSIAEQDRSVKSQITALELPNTPVPLNSALYVQRPPTEYQAYEEIIKPGALIKIKAPRKMGKTSLVMRILAQAKSRGYHTVRLNLLQAEDSILSNLERLLRWFCANITLQLGIESLLNDYWDTDLGLKVSCTNYIQEYILEQLNTPLVVTLDEVNQLFSYPQVAQEFLPLLRFWHEEANNIPVWQKLRLIVTHSTEIRVPLHLHQSPFNVGLSLRLKPFNWEQVQELAKRYGLNQGEFSIQLEQLQSLEEIVDGHPYLLNLAFYHLTTQDHDIEKLIEEAATDTGIYRSHLRSHLIAFREYPELAMAYKQVVQSTEAITLNSIVAYELENMGLVKLKGNATIPLCELYRLYFRDRL
ncbi:AAA-like domain-containing protein [Pleurocapsales cyanobacterium LEGE 10410]|nr:AAA-like domain-containing protein [Pleurocapsales cyanobacterium LEGE 10410]